MAAPFGFVPGSFTPSPPQTPPAYVMTQVLGPGSVQFTAQESEYYSQLLTHVDPAGSGYVDAAIGAGFLGASGLPREMLQQIWGIADVYGQGYLSVEGFFVACRLVAWAQAGVPPSPDKVQSDPPMLPDFPNLPRRRSPSEASHGSRPPSVGHSEQSELQPVIAGRDEHVRRASEAVRHATSRSTSPVRTFTHDRWAPSQRERRKYASLFQRTDWDGDGFVQGSEASALLERSHVDQGVLSMAWELSDQDHDGKLDFKEFSCLVHIVSCIRRGAVLQPGAPLPVPLSQTLQYLEPLEVLAAERERSRSRSASPHPSVSGTPPQTGLQPSQDAGWMAEDPFAAKDSGFTDAAPAFKTFPSDPFAGQKETGGEALDGWATDGFGTQPKSKKEKKDKKKKGAGDKDVEANDNWTSSFPTDLPSSPKNLPGGDNSWADQMPGPTESHKLSFADDPFVTQQERPAALFDSSPKSPKGLAGHEHDHKMSEAIRHFHSIVGIDKNISSKLRDEVSRLDRELRRIEELDVQLERHVAQETQESERLQKEKQHLDRQLAEAKHALSTLREDRKSAHLEGLSLRRDRVHLEDELAFLRKMAEDEEETLSVLKGTNQHLEHSYRELEANAQLLDQQQKEMIEQIARERDQFQGHQRHISELQHTLERLGQNRVVTSSPHNMASNGAATRVPDDARRSQVHAGDQGRTSSLHVSSVNSSQNYSLPSTAPSMQRVPGSFLSQRQDV